MLISYVRTIVLYLALILTIRLMGKRQIGEMEPAEFVVTMLIANLASIPMQDAGIPLLSGLVPIITVLGVQLLLAVASLRWMGVRRLLCGKPVMLIGEGKILLHNLKRARITLDELTEHLREKDVLDLSQVQYAILETNGKVSVFSYPQYAPANAKEAGVSVPSQSIPVTLISDGKLLEKNLPIAERDRAWVEDLLCREGCTPEDVLLLTVDKTGKTYFSRKEAGA